LAVFSSRFGLRVRGTARGRNIGVAGLRDFGCVAIDYLLVDAGSATPGYTNIADSGRKITREFCPSCGSPLFTRAETLPDSVFLKTGSVDEPEQIEPNCQIWTRRAVPWVYIDEKLPCFPEGCPSRPEGPQD